MCVQYCSTLISSHSVYHCRLFVLINMVTYLFLFLLFEQIICIDNLICGCIRFSSTRLIWFVIVIMFIIINLPCESSITFLLLLTHYWRISLMITDIRDSSVVQVNHHVRHHFVYFGSISHYNILTLLLISHCRNPILSIIGFYFHYWKYPSDTLP